MGPPPPDVSPYGTDRPNGSPHMSAPPPPQVSTAHSQTATPPLRHPTTSYDTRPPPPLPPPSGFAAVNYPTPQSGFAAVNSKPDGTPSSSYDAPAKEQRPQPYSKSADQTPARASVDDEKTPVGSGSTNKRTPSTTHPYQMSEAFANRHHHCERTDSLNRGIWTWYGLGGTQERPTAPATEMYLVCNHDGCRRIDWRTVHGLQCHIVKNHEIPKGTIGSLEKALAAYGVPVSEIEAIEKRDGVGSGGTMADPKNLKIKSRLRESGGTPLSAQKQYQPNESDSPVPVLGPRKSGSAVSSHLPIQNESNSEPGRTPLSVQPQYRPSESDGPSSYRGPRKSGPTISPHLPIQNQPKPEVDSERKPIVPDRQSEHRPLGGFAAVNTTWQGVNVTPSKNPASPDHDARGGPVPDTRPVNRTAQGTLFNGVPSRFWSSWQPTSLPRASEGSPNSHPMRAVQPDISSEANATSSSNAAKPNSDAIETQKQVPLEEAKNSDERQERTDKISEIPLESTNMTTGETDAQDAQMTGTGEEESQTLPGPASSAAQPEQPEQPPSVEVNGDVTKKDDVAPVLEKVEVGKVEPEVTEQDATSIMQSPEVSHRTRPSRRESRRTSVATALSSKAGTEKAKEEEIEFSSTTHTGSKTGSAIDDDGDSITVNVAALKAEKERKDEDDKTKAASRRLPNGRFMRRMNGR